MTVIQTIHSAVELGKRKDYAGAIQLLEEVLKIDPDNGLAYANLANALALTGRMDESFAAFERAIALTPKNPIAHRGYGSALTRVGRVNEAIQQHMQSLKLAPNDPETHGHLAHALLLVGDLKRGFGEYEWRWKCDSFDGPRRTFTQPRWTGGKISEQTILIWGEQGFGDTIQFIRYAKLLESRGANVLVEAQPELARLIRRMSSVVEFVPRGSILPAFDFQAPLLSLPGAFNTTVNNIPANVPYLTAHPQLAAAWREKLIADTAKLKVGIAWAGRPTHNNDRNRSCGLSAFAPLTAVENVSFYSLQKGDSASQASNPPNGMRLFDHTARLADFDDTAALIANLDLVIAIDTAMVHLAGAMGKPVWTMLPFAPDWRWMLNRNDSPWYPTMKLFRQPHRGDWEGAFNQAAKALMVFESPTYRM